MAYPFALSLQTALLISPKATKYIIVVNATFCIDKNIFKGKGKEKEQFRISNDHGCGCGCGIILYFFLSRRGCAPPSALSWRVATFRDKIHFFFPYEQL